MKCAAQWITPHIRCPPASEKDHIVLRSQAPEHIDNPENHQWLCWACHKAKHAEPKAAEILSLYGVRGRLKHTITKELFEWAVKRFEKRKRQLLGI